MSIRFLEQRDIVGRKGFVRRKYGFDTVYLLLLTVAGWLLIMGAYSAFEELNAAAYYAVITLVFAGITGAVYFFINNDREIMHALEFQNALFSAVTRHNSEFYAILSHEGRVVYIHPDYQRQLTRLAAGGEDTLQALCGIVNMDDGKRDLLMRLMREGKKGTFHFSVTATDDSQPLNMLLQPINMYTGEEYHKDITLVLEPISRPSGFFLLFAEKESPYSALVKNLDKLEIGYFTADKNLTFRNASNIFASVSGYSKHELAGDGVALTDIFPDITPGDLAGISGDMPFAKISVSAPRNGRPGARCMLIVAKLDASVYKSDFVGVALRYEGLESRMDFDMDEASAAVMLESSPVACSVVAPSGNIVYANRAMRRTLGVSEEGRVKENFLSFIHSDTRGNAENMLKNAVAAGGDAGAATLRTEITGAGEGGERTLVIRPVVGSAGHVSHLAVYLTENDGAVRLAECAAHSQKMQAIGQLAGGIAHDFNNLLTAMLGFCDMLLERHPAGDESFSDIMQVRQNANRAAGLVRQLLAFSRRQTLRPRVIDITDIVADLSDLLSRLLGENIRPDIKHGYDLHRIRVDIGQLEQVIVNLAVNARDAMNAAGDKKDGVLTVTTENITVDGAAPLHRYFSPEGEKAPPGDYVMLSVRDNGTGIPEDALEKIFEPFFSTKEIGEGTGLGLATVYGIVKQNNGYIYLDTSEGQGACFHILFPRYRESAEAAQRREEEKKTEENFAQQDITGHGTVLLVEDEAPVRMFSASALKSKGYTVIEAENGFEATDVMEQRGGEIDIIVTDVMMPGMNGPSFIENIQNDYPDIKVIFISGYAEDQFMEQFKDKRLVDFLPKPYSLKQLAGKVKAMAG